MSILTTSDSWEDLDLPIIKESLVAVNIPPDITFWLLTRKGPAHDDDSVLASTVDSSCLISKAYLILGLKDLPSEMTIAVCEPCASLQGVASGGFGFLQR